MKYIYNIKNAKEFCDLVKNNVNIANIVVDLRKVIE